MIKETLTSACCKGRWQAGKTGNRGLRPERNPNSEIRSLPGFTLIELLVVIAVIALLAAMIMPITGAVSRNKIRTRARVEMARIQAAIESYKAKLGHYPPDASPSPPGRAALNQLYYELVGTTVQPGKASTLTYTTLDGSSTITAAQIKTLFGVDGFINTTKGAVSDESPPAVTFLTGLRPDQVAVIPDPHGGAGTPNKITLLVGYPWKRVVSSAFFNVDPIPTSQGINPWRYRCHTDQQHPTLNNPDSYDLWLDVNIGGTVYRICNWSDHPLKVTTSSDN